MVLIIISSPEGAGKTTIAYEVLRRIPSLQYCVSTTTRKKRANEVDGEDYHFISKEEFESIIAQGGFLEYQQHLENYYGVQKKEVESASLSRPTLLTIDIFGAVEVKQKMGDEVLLIFIKPPSIEELEKRLRNREDNEKVISLRVDRVKEVLTMESQCDVTVVNDKLEDAIKQTVSLVQEFLSTKQK